MVWDWSTIEHIEEVKMIMLNRANRVLGVAHLTKGGLNGSVIDTRVILAHNHPSGNLVASEADKRITNNVKRH